eukprot:TRINITY_DN69194_c0_g1_i1.p1 TRINITY_DN69194_c0_g1~~TRINITY_DN69194_c0_g1_i1.p1  ORF type:complete len:750 (+),score=134.82 TRINITY_DN69194_c0_g1_i1:227-2476(+)
MGQSQFPPVSACWSPQTVLDPTTTLPQEAVCVGRPAGHTPGREDVCLTNPIRLSEKSLTSLAAATSEEASLKVLEKIQKDSQQLDEHHVLPEARSKLDRLQRRDFSSAILERDDTVLSDLVTISWPSIRLIVEDVINERVASALKSEIGFIRVDQCVEMGKVALSNTPIEIVASRAYKKTICGKDAIELDMAMRWSTLFEKVQVKCGPVSVELSEIYFDGEACLLFHPLVPMIQIFGGLSFFFLNPPSIRLELTGVVEAVKSLVNRKVHRLLTTALVLPHLIPIYVNDAIVQDRITHVTPLPIGVFRVRVLEATDLVPADYSFLRPASCDPYCLLKLGSCEFQTKTVKRKLDAAWGDEVFDFLVFNERQLLQVEVWDEDKTNSDDALGCLPGGGTSVFDLLDRQASSGNDHVWLPLDISKVKGKGKREYQSSICLQAQFFSVSARAPFKEAQSDRCSVLVVAKIFAVNGVPEQPLSGTRISLNVGSAPEVSTRGCCAVPTQRSDGLTDDMVNLAARLYTDFHLSPEAIGGLLKATVDDATVWINEIVDQKTSLDRGDGLGKNIGWNQMLFAVAQNSDLVDAKLVIHRNESKNEDVLMHISVTELCMRARRETAVLDGSATVDVSFEALKLWPLSAEIAVRAFSLGSDVTSCGGLEVVLEQMREAQKTQPVESETLAEFEGFASLTELLRRESHAWTSSSDSVAWLAPQAKDARHTANVGVSLFQTSWSDCVDVETVFNNCVKSQKSISM